MNRPYLPKYVTRSNYTIELEKYCDELENELKTIKSNGVFKYSLALEDELKSCNLEVEKYKRALDLAIKEIVKHNDKYPMPLGDQYKMYKKRFLMEANNE